MLTYAARKMQHTSRGTVLLEQPIVARGCHALKGGGGGLRVPVSVMVCVNPLISGALF